MWGIGALRDGAKGLVKQGAGAVRHGVAAGAKLLDNLDETYDEDDYEDDYGAGELGSEESDGLDGDAAGLAAWGSEGEQDRDGKEPATGDRNSEEVGEGAAEGGPESSVGAQLQDRPGELRIDALATYLCALIIRGAEGNIDDAFGLDPTSDEFQAVKTEMQRLSNNYLVQIRGMEKQISKLRRGIRRARQEADMNAEAAEQQRHDAEEAQKATEAEMAELEDRVATASQALEQEVAGRQEDLEALHAQLREERNEGDAEKEGLRQTVQMLQRELGDHNASLSEAHQRLEQSLARAAASEEAAAKTGLEAEELRERLAALEAAADQAAASKPTEALESSGSGRDREQFGGDDADDPSGEPPAAAAVVENDGNGDESSGSREAARDSAPDVTTAEGGDSSQEALSASPGEASRLRQEQERASEAEECLRSASAALDDLRRENDSLREHVAELERRGQEAMQAAATEAERAAEVREEFDSAAAELATLRARQAEWAEEAEHTVELKGTLEKTRDDLDELRTTSGEAEAIAARRLQELEVRLEEASTQRDALEQQARSDAEEAMARLDELEAKHASQAESAATAAASEMETLREALSEARASAEALEQEAGEAAASKARDETALEGALEKATALETQLAEQELAAEGVRAERDALRIEADRIEGLMSDVAAAERATKSAQARADSAEAQVVALKVSAEGGGRKEGESGEGGSDADGVQKALEDLETTLRARFEAERDEALAGLRAELAEAGRELASARAALEEKVGHIETLAAQADEDRRKADAELEQQREGHAHALALEREVAAAAAKAQSEGQEAAVSELALSAERVMALEEDLAQVKDASETAERERATEREADARAAAEERDAAEAALAEANSRAAEAEARLEEFIAAREASGNEAAAAASSERARLEEAVVGQAAAREAAETALRDKRDAAAAEQARLQECLREAEKELQESREAADNLRLEGDSTRGRVGELERELAEVRAGMEAEAARAEMVLREWADLKTALDDRDEETDAAATLRQQVEELIQEIAAAKEADLLKQSRVDEAIARARSLEEELEDAKQTLGAIGAAEAQSTSNARAASLAAAAAEEEVSALREQLAAQTAEVSSLRHQVSAAESTIVDMDAARALAEEEKATLRAEIDATARRAAQEHRQASDLLRRELVEDWKTRVADERARVSEKEQELETLRVALEEAEARCVLAATEKATAEVAAAAAAAEAKGAADVSAWEVKSLREELRSARERSAELSASLEDARKRESAASRAAEAAVREELEGLREAVRTAEAARGKAEDGVARMKDKKKRDLQEVRRLNERMLTQQQSRLQEVAELDATISDLRSKLSVLEARDASRQEAIANAQQEADELRREAASGNTNVPSNGNPVSVPAGANTSSESVEADPGGSAPTVGDKVTADQKVHSSAPKDADVKEEQEAADRRDALRRAEEQEKELVLLRNVVEKLKREIEGLKSDLQDASAGREEVEEARETLTIALSRANARIAELTSKSAQLTRGRSAMVAQIRALEEQVNIAVLAQKRTSESPRDFDSRGDVSDSPVIPAPLDEHPSSGSATPMRQRHRPQGESFDLEDGGRGVGAASLVGSGGQDDYDDGEDKTQPGDHVKALLLSCASSALCTKAVDANPAVITWLQQLPPQRTWLVAVSYLGFVHALLLYTSVTC